MKKKLYLLAALGLLLPLGFQAPSAAAGPSVVSTDVVSASAAGEVGNSTTSGVAMTPDGRYVAYTSGASNILPDFAPQNGWSQVYVYDRQTHVTDLVTVNYDGTAAQSSSAQPTMAISNDGRYVLFTSGDTTLTGNTDTTKHMFIRDRTLGVTTQIDTGSLNAEYVEPHAMSGDAAIIVYSGDQGEYRSGGLPNAVSNPILDKYLYNRTTGQTMQLPAGTLDPVVSNDGHYVVYNGLISNPASPDYPRAVFMYDVTTGATTQATDPLSPDSRGGVLSPDNTHLAYFEARNTHDSTVFDFTLRVKDLNTQVTREIPDTLSLSAVQPTNSLSFSADNRLISFTKNNQNPTVVDIVNDTQLNLTSLSTYFRTRDMQLSADGTLVAYVAWNPAVGLQAQAYLARIDFPAIPKAPTNLQIPSPTSRPVLTWDAPAGNPASYVIYRDGTNIGTSTSTTYTDTSVSVVGQHTYYVVALGATGVAGPPSSSVTITFDDRTAPAFTSANSAAVNVRDLMNFTVTTSGNPAAGVTESGALPNGITFVDNGDGTGSFIGQPSPGTQGTYNLTLTATNSIGTATQQFTLSVNNTQTAPTFLSSDSVSVTYGMPFSFTVSTTGNGIPNITKVGGNGSNLPKGVHFKDNNDGTATISGAIKEKNTSGISTFTLQAKNQNGTVQQQFSITWEP